MAFSGNKGEWSEPYVLLKLLADKKLHVGDANLNAIKDLVYPIIKIIREEAKGTVEYICASDLIFIKGQEELQIPISEFINYSKKLFDKIKNSTGVFQYDEIEEFLNSIHVYSMKASSKLKTDITIQLREPGSVFDRILGFSIKSQVGSPSTLINASGATNFIYQLQGNIDEATITTFNATKKFADKFELLKKKNISLIFLKPSSKVYNSNLQAVDGGFAKVVADMLVLYYSNRVGNTLQKNIEAITQTNPLNFDIDTNSTLYEMKLKDFLTKHALGMQASEKWFGDFKTSGGYLIVKTDGEILCYHFYYHKQFQDYLLANTKFETPSTSRHNFGFIYKDEDCYYVNLNLQVRFIV